MVTIGKIVTLLRRPPVAGRLFSRFLNRSAWAANRHGGVALEFAFVSVPFMLFMLFVCEFTYGMFTQELLDGALHRAIDQMRGGFAATPPANAAGFVNSFLCPQFYGLLECNATRVFVNVTPVAQGGDFYSAFPYGALPISSNTLDLSNFSGSSAYCTPAPEQFYEVSAIYVGPTFVGYLLPNVLSVKTASGSGLPSVVHATLSTVGFSAENFPQQNGGAATCSTPS